MKHDQILFSHDIEPKTLGRSAGTDICLNCPLPPETCDSVDYTTPQAVKKYKTPPLCPLLFAIWHGFSPANGLMEVEQEAAPMLDPDDPTSLRRYRDAVREIKSRQMKEVITEQWTQYSN